MVSSDHTPMDVSLTAFDDIILCANAGHWEAKASGILVPGPFPPVTDTDQNRHRSEMFRQFVREWGHRGGDRRPEVQDCNRHVKRREVARWTGMVTETGSGVTSTPFM